MSQTSATVNKPFLSARNVSKSFGEVQVLQGIDLQLCCGEVHALLGENGAGKSTLVKLLSGFEPITSGELVLHSEDGEQLVGRHWNNEIAEQSGVVLIHQEFNLAEQLTVAENIFLGNELKRGPLLDNSRMRNLASAYLSDLDCDINPDTPISKLAVSAKQMVEIAKARSKKTRLLILDEPTAVLTGKESQVLFRLIDLLKQEGVAIVYISHKLEEIEQIADRITVLRDGALVGHYDGRQLNQDDMARLMVGRELQDLFPAIPKPAADAQLTLEVTNITVPGLVNAASFSLRQGEVLGFAGLVGSGRSALMEAIVGLRNHEDKADSEIKVNGVVSRFKSMAAARKQGLAYLTKDRKGKGLLLNMGLKLNYSLFALHKFSRLFINSKQEQRAFDNAVQTFDIRMKDRTVMCGNLSGGNQQKLLLAKIMAAEPAIIIIDEPTRGIDIGTKSQIYHFIANLAASHHSIIIISSDIMEIIGMSHRVAVMCRGSLTGILEGDEIEEHEIMRYATGLKNKNQQSGMDLNDQQFV